MSAVLTSNGTSDVQNLGSMNSLIKCVFCGYQFINRSNDLLSSKFLECCHVICAICSVLWHSKEKKTCPECNMEMEKNLLETKILQELIVHCSWTTEDRNAHCGMHEEVLATHWCENCDEFICGKCIEHHKQLKVTKDHVMKTKEEYFETVTIGKEGNFPCKLHPKEQLVIYCSTCDDMTCRDCQLSTHTDHSYSFISDIIDTTKVELFEKNSTLKYYLTLIEKGIDLIDIEKENLTKQKEGVKDKITEACEILISEVIRRKQNTLNRVEEVAENKIKNLDEKKRILQRISKRLKHCTVFTAEVLKTSSDSSIIHSKKHILRFMDLISKSVINLPNPNFKTRLMFLSKVPEIIKNFSELGVIDTKNICTNQDVFWSLAQNLSTTAIESGGLLQISQNVNSFALYILNPSDIDTSSRATVQEETTSLNSSVPRSFVEVLPTITDVSISPVVSTAKTDTIVNPNITTKVTETKTMEPIAQIDLTDETPSPPRPSHVPCLSVKKFASTSAHLSQPICSISPQKKSTPTWHVPVIVADDSPQVPVQNNSTSDPVRQSLPSFSVIPIQSQQMSSQHMTPPVPQTLSNQTAPMASSLQQLPSNLPEQIRRRNEMWESLAKKYHMPQYFR